jgi:soluble cytochrome b562
MKKRLLLMSCAVGLLVIPAQAEEHTELGKHMESMNDAFKAFRRETDPVKGATQARIAQTEALKAAAEIPAKVKAMPAGADKDKASVEYRKAMGKLYITLCEVEEAFLAGKIDEVAKHLETLKGVKKEGHDKFMDED